MGNKICFLASGRHIRTRKLAHHLAWRGHNVHFVTFEQVDKTVEWGNVTPHFIKPKFRNYLSFIFPTKELTEIVRKNSFDILHGFQVTNYGLLGARIGFAPYIVGTLGSDILYTPFIGNRCKNYILQRIVQYTFNKANIINLETKHALNFIKSHFRVESEKIRIFPYGVETQIFRFPEDQKPKEFLVICPRAIKKLYNTDVIIKAIPLCVRHYPTIKFTFIAGIVDKEYFSEVQKCVKELHIEESVRFIKDILTHEEMAKEYSKARIMISIPSSDNLPKSVLEGVLCKTVPILSDIPANRELEEMGIPVVFVAKNCNQYELAEKLLWTIKNSDEIEEESKKVSCLIKRELAIDACVSKLESIYQELIDKRI